MLKPVPDAKDPPPHRLALIDIARGTALGGMLLFHVDWDLAYWGWIETGPAGSSAWMVFGHAVAATFLFVSGLCLVLARRHGPASALRRLAVLAITAAGITAVTYVLFPADYIFFGILHCMALCNLIGLAFLRLPGPVTALAALAAAVAPAWLKSPRFDGPLWWWLGLSSAVPRTVDFRPLLPWLSAVLFGVAVAPLLSRLPELRPRATLTWASAWAGRHSLALYLIHQPILFAGLWLMAAAHPRLFEDQRAAFNGQCQAQCLAAEAGLAGCVAACDCVFRRLEPEPENRGGQAPTRPEIVEATRVCVGPDVSPRPASP